MGAASTGLENNSVSAAAAVGNDEPMLLYNLACYESLAGRSEEAVAHLRRAVALDESYRALARDDPDFDPVRSFDMSGSATSAGRRETSR